MESCHTKATWIADGSWILTALRGKSAALWDTKSGRQLLLLRDLTAEENGLIVMCSALGNQKAMESREHKHGMFTQAFLEALEGKATKTEGAVYLDSINAYINKRVGDLSNGYQSPVAGRPLSIRDFPLSKP